MTNQMTPQQVVEALERVREALSGLSSMYTHAWDLADGGLIMLEGSIPKFEDAHGKAVQALSELPAAIEAVKGMVGREVDEGLIFNELARVCRDAVPGSSLACLLPSHRATVAHALAPYLRPPVEQQTVSQWRDIETAPKDATPILAWSSMGVVKAWFDKSGWCIFDGEWKSWTKPTHWMPLPKPPQHFSSPIWGNEQLEGGKLNENNL